MNNLNLENKNWKDFEIGDLFEIENCRCSKVTGIKTGVVPYVGATNKNNGVMSFLKGNEDLITKGNCIAFICDGEGSMGFSIYKKENFIGSTTVKIGRSKYLNSYNGKFITTAADKNASKYNFGFKRNSTHLKKEKILLPTTSIGEPDRQFMEAYMKEKEEQILQGYQSYVSTRIDELKNYGDILPLEEKEWGEFFIEDIFKIKSGKRLTKKDMKSGSRPFIGATDSNNGITAYSGNINSSIDSNVLGVNYNGSVVENFYHPYEAIFSDDVKRLSFIDIPGNKFQYLFVKTFILKQKSKYQYSYKFNGDRMARQKILLPITHSGEPDYTYMEGYMKQMELKKLQKYLTNKNISSVV